MKTNPPDTSAPPQGPDGGAGRIRTFWQNTGNGATQSYGTAAAQSRYVRRAAFSKPLETMGRKATELRRSECGAEGPGVPGALCPPGCERKPSETMGRKAKY